MNALVWSPGAAERTSADLHAEHFADPWCRAVVTAVTELVAEREPVNARTIHARLVARAVHRQHDSWRLILADVTAPMAELECHLALVAEQHRRRSVRDALVGALDELSAGVPVEALTARLTDRLGHLERN